MYNLKKIIKSKKSKKCVNEHRFDVRSDEHVYLQSQNRTFNT